MRELEISELSFRREPTMQLRWSRDGVLQQKWEIIKFLDGAVSGRWEEWFAVETEQPGEIW